MSRTRFMSLLLVLGTLLLYLPVCHYPFVNYDDDDYVTDNPFVQNGLTWKGVAWAFTTWHAANWHPLTWLSLMADYQFFGLDAGVFHTVNVLLHAANSVLLLLLLLRWTKALWPSAIAAALFAWHPMHVESVAWVSERKDVLSTLFALLALLCWTSHVTSDKWRVTGKTDKQAPGVSPVTCHSSLFYWLALICFALGLMSKPMVVTLPIVLLLLDYWPLNRMRIAESGMRNWAKLLPEKIPFFALSAASCAVTFLAQHYGGAVVSLEHTPMSFRAQNVPVAYAGYLFKMIWPLKLATFYPLNPVPAWQVAASVIALAAISWLVWRTRRSNPYGLVGWLWFVGTLVPVIGLVQVGGAAMADRYTYLPSIGLFMAIVFGIRGLAERSRFPKPAIAVAGILISSSCLLITARQLRFWRDSEILFRHALAVTKDNDIVHINLGVTLDLQGRTAEALAEYRQAAKLEPGRWQVHNNLGNLLDKMGRRDEALAEYRDAVRLRPDLASLHSSLGGELAALGQFDEALKEIFEAVRLDPNDPGLRVETAKVFLQAGRDTEAIPYFHQALQLAPNELHILTYFAEVLASDENSSGRDGNLAFTLASQANKLSGGAEPVMLDTLAMAQAELGRFDAAQQTQQEAVRLAENNHQTNDIPVLRQRLELYKNRQPFRQSFIYTNAPAANLLKP